MKLCHPLLLGAVALLAPACTVVATTPVIPIAPPGVHVRAEVARGYAAYAAPLTAWGAWIPDRTNGVLWCPGPAATGGEPFQPYLSHGHWDVSDTPIGGAPAGSPVWRGERSDTWSEITSHHGWWVRVADEGPTPWCWVPGAEETAARVLWREGDGFIGWAPEPPDWVVYDDADGEDLLDWTFTLLGTLLDGLPEQNQLTGPARDQARAATASSRSPGSPLQRKHVGPSSTSISAAHKTLADYVVAHPDAIAALSTAVSGGSKTESKGSSGSKKQASDEKSKTSEAVAPMMPSAMAYYDAFLAQPPLGPAGLVPGMRAGAPAGGAGRVSASAGATGSALSAAVDAHAHARAEALRLGPSASHGGYASSGGYTSSGGSTYSYTPSGSSHSSGSHHGSSRSSRSSHSHK